MFDGQDEKPDKNVKKISWALETETVSNMLLFIIKSELIS